MNTISSPFCAIFALATVISASARAQPTTLPENLASLEGKHVIVGRLVLCEPKTFTPDLSHAGKPAIIVSFRRNDKLAHMGSMLSRLPESARSMIEDQQKGGMLSFRFEDGKVLDTCGDIGRSRIIEGIDLAPGEIVEATDQPSIATSGVAAIVTGRPQECPVSIISASSGVSFGHALADVMTTSELERRVDRAAHGGVDKHYLDIRVLNNSKKSVKAFEFAAVYANKMGDSTTSVTYISQNDKSIASGATFKSSAMDRTQISQNGAGEVKLFISRVRFDDDTS